MSDFNSIECHTCAKQLALVDECDLNGSYFHCSEACGIKGREENTKRRAERDAVLARIKARATFMVQG